MFNFGSSLLAALFWLQNKLLYCGFHGPQHQRGTRQTDQFPYSHCLVQLQTGNVQGAGVQHGQIRALDGLGLPDKTFQCCYRNIKRYVQRFKRTSQRAQMVDGQINVSSV